MAFVLVIDDEEMVRATLRAYLEGAGHQVQEARHGGEALPLAQRRRPDLVVTDIIMPEKEGIETILELRRLDGKLPILAISGGGRTGNLDFLGIARKFGAVEVLSKPFTRDVFLAAVTRCLKAKP